MNAAEHMIALLPAESVRRLAALHVGRFAAPTVAAASRAQLDLDEAKVHARERWGGDLCALLNTLTRSELAAIALGLKMSTAARSPELRAKLWDAGAKLERHGQAVDMALQPRPVLLGGHLVVQAPARGLHPATAVWPRPIPPPHDALPPGDEPDSLDELLAAADRALGVRLGQRGADKGAWGVRAAELLGVPERGGSEPDWRGDVEIKTVPIEREPSGLWRVTEDPAIAMATGEAASKLAHTLWLARADLPDGDATLVSWYLLAGDADVMRLVRRYLHLRPKGPAGTDQRGLYLHKRFFADAGLLATLNGPETWEMIVDELRIVGSTQTNVIMAAELTRVAQVALRKRPPEPRKEGLGQLVYPFDPDLAWAATTYMRTPTRVLRDVYRSRANRLEPLYEELLADVSNDQRRHGRNGDGISVEARRVEQFAAGERQVVGTVKNALIAGAARRGMRWHVEPNHPSQLWIARLDDNEELVISIDLGGGSLSQRGWRRDAGEAPLREHLAATLVMLTRFDPRRDALVDPMCGSGTIPIEAVLAARGIPRAAPALGQLGLGPPPPARALFADSSPIVVGCDHDIGVLGHAKANALAAGVQTDITWQRADVAQLKPETIAQIAIERGKQPPESGVLLSNPPYGERLADDELGPLYHDIAVAASRFRGWRAAFLVASPLFERVVSDVLGQARIKKPLANANLRAYFFLWDL